jgi:hypothetical protein
MKRDETAIPRMFRGRLDEIFLLRFKSEGLRSAPDGVIGGHILNLTKNAGAQDQEAKYQEVK